MIRWMLKLWWLVRRMERARERYLDSALSETISYNGSLDDFVSADSRLSLHLAAKPWIKFDV